MPLTPEDVQNKEFTTVRLREGYDMQEVDEFLDEVEAALSTLTRENEDLRQKLAALSRGEAPPARPAEAKPAAAAPAAAPAPAPVPAGTPPHEAAAKVLALAQRTADELTGDAKVEADQLLADARSRAEQLDADTRMKAEKLEQEARRRAEELEQESTKRRSELIGGLETERDQLQRRLEDLRGFEREYRSRLKAYFEGQLRQLESTGTADSAAAQAGASAPTLRPVDAEEAQG